MRVCIAEKPSVAGEIARVLGALERREGYYEGGGWQVTWTLGHLCCLKEPDDYDAAWHPWTLRQLPMLPAPFGIKLRPGKAIKRQFQIVAGLLGAAELIVNCGDAGQEGELIQRWVMQLAGPRCPVKRLWISSLTEQAIREGFANLREQSDFDNLYAAGSARAIGDWLLGMNATRAYTLRFAQQRQVLSVGRVQTPTLALIVRRDEEIARFKPEDYFQLRTRYREASFLCVKPERLKTQAEAQALLAKLTGRPLTIANVKVKATKQPPPPLFDLTSLQVEANNRLQLSAEETLAIAQALYEQKFLTYPRVDTHFLTQDLHAQVPAIVRGLTAYAHLAAPILAAPVPKSKRVFNDLKVTDHHAIIPTGVMPPSTLPVLHKRLFDMVTRRFLANFYPDAELSQSTVEAWVPVGGATNLLGDADHSLSVPFRAQGRQVLRAGWRALYAGQKLDEEEAQPLPTFAAGESGPHQPEVLAKRTQPPKRYTEAALLRAMETCGKALADSDLRDAMKANGIGRPSTRAAIIETLKRRGYIRQEGRALRATQQGQRLIALIATPLLASVELTGQWEHSLRLIEAGQRNAADFINEMRALAQEVVNAVRGGNEGPSLHLKP